MKLILALFVGVAVGMFTVALCVVASDAPIDPYEKMP